MRIQTSAVARFAKVFLRLIIVERTEPTDAASAERGFRDDLLQPMSCSRSDVRAKQKLSVGTENEQRVVRWCVSLAISSQESHVSNTSSATSLITETPIRQSAQDGVSSFLAWHLGPIIPDYPLKDLKLYEPRWVWPPSFRHTEQYQRLLESIEHSGVFHPLLILPDSQIIDGQHRYACAKKLDLECVPVRIIDVPLPLEHADQLAIEEWIVYDTIARRHLTKAQATEMLYDLLRGRHEAQTDSARLANLKQGKETRNVRPYPNHLTVKELATRAGKSQRSVERAVTVMRHAPPEIQAELHTGKLTLGGAERAMKATWSVRNDSPPASSAPREPSRHEASKITCVAENFVDSARVLVRKARIWDREGLEQLVHALQQIETNLRDAGATAREEHRDD